MHAVYGLSIGGSSGATNSRDTVNWIPEWFPDVAAKRFSFVHIDVDLYEPHRDAIEFFWPRLTLGGVMLFDDYGEAMCPGVRQAVDEAFAPTDIVEAPTAQAFVISGERTQ